MSLDALTQTATRQPAARPAFLEATIATTAASEASAVYVLDPAGGEGEPRLGPCPWTPHPGPVFPARGDRALIARSDRGEWWIVAWEAA